MKKKRMIMIVAMVLVLVWREDVFAVESGTTQVALQADWLQEGDYQYSVEEDETVTLRNYIGTESVIVTPKEVGGKEVTRIGDSCFLRKTDLRAVQISEGIVEIGESAFAEDGQYSDTTAGFISIVMPKTLKKVGKSAFQGTRITQIYFYDGLESIGDNAFMYCSSLSKIRIPDSVEKVGQFLFLGAGKPYEESQDSAMKIFGGKIAEELAKDNQRAEYGGEEMQEISIQYWLEKKENETKEEVIGQKYFDKNDIFYTRDFSIVGKTGNIYSYDFHFQRSKNNSNERFCRTINKLNKTIRDSTIFNWIDTKEKRTDKSELIVILNDENQINKTDENALNEYEIQTIKFCDIGKFLSCFI